MWDGILVYSSDQEEYGRNLEQTLRCLQEAGITLNRSKNEVIKKEIVFFGCVFSGDGMKPDSTKVEVIVKIKAPTDVRRVEKLSWHDKYRCTFYPKLLHYS